MGWNIILDCNAVGVDDVGCQCNAVGGTINPFSIADCRFAFSN